MKATISTNTTNPKGFYLGHKHITLLPKGSVSGDYDDALLVSLINTGFDVSEDAELEPTPEPDKETKKGKK